MQCDNQGGEFFGGAALVATGKAMRTKADQKKREKHEQIKEITIVEFGMNGNRSEMRTQFVEHMDCGLAEMEGA